jgi:transketolase
VACLPAVLAGEAPTYIRFNPTPARERHLPYALGRAEVGGEEGGVALLTCGFLHAEAVRAAALLRARGMPVRVLNLRSLKPLDEGALLEAARTSELLVTLEDHFRTGGLFTAVAEVFLLKRLSPRVLPLALEERFFKPLLLPELLEHEGFSARAIADRVLEAL